MSTPTYKRLTDDLQPVRFYTNSDPYFYTVDNRPLEDLDYNIGQLISAADAGRRASLISALSESAMTAGLFGMGDDRTIGLTAEAFTDEVVISPGALLTNQPVSESISDVVLKKAASPIDVTLQIPEPNLIDHERYSVIQIKYTSFGEGSPSLYEDSGNTYLPSSVLNGKLEFSVVHGVEGLISEAEVPEVTEGWTPLYVAKRVYDDSEIYIYRHESAPGEVTLAQPQASGGSTSIYPVALISDYPLEDTYTLHDFEVDGDYPDGVAYAIYFRDLNSNASTGSDFEDQDFILAKYNFDTGSWVKEPDPVIGTIVTLAPSISEDTDTTEGYLSPGMSLVYTGYTTTPTGKQVNWAPIGDSYYGQQPIIYNTDINLYSSGIPRKSIIRNSSSDNVSVFFEQGGDTLIPREFMLVNAEGERTVTFEADYGVSLTLPPGRVAQISKSNAVVKAIEVRPDLWSLSGDLDVEPVTPAVYEMVLPDPYQNQVVLSEAYYLNSFIIVDGIEADPSGIELVLDISNVPLGSELKVFNYSAAQMSVSTTGYSNVIFGSSLGDVAVPSNGVVSIRAIREEYEGAVLWLVSGDLEEVPV